MGDNAQYIHRLLPIHSGGDSNSTEKCNGKLHHLNAVTVKRTLFHCIGAAKPADNLNI